MFADANKFSRPWLAVSRTRETSLRLAGSSRRVKVRRLLWAGEDLHLHAFRHKVLNLACILFHHLPPNPAEAIISDGASITLKKFKTRVLKGEL